MLHGHRHRHSSELHSVAGVLMAWALLACWYHLMHHIGSSGLSIHKAQGAGTPPEDAQADAAPLAVPDSEECRWQHSAAQHAAVKHIALSQEGQHAAAVRGDVQTCMQAAMAGRLNSCLHPGLVLKVHVLVGLITAVCPVECMPCILVGLCCAQGG